MTEVYKLEKGRCRVFWRALQTLWIKLYGSNKIYISAINGHAIAGGCLIALACDYRIMANGSYKIGLNETILVCYIINLRMECLFIFSLKGLQPPFWLSEMMKNTIGHRQAEKALQFGELYSTEEALSLKLVDKIVDLNDLESESAKIVQEWMKIPSKDLMLDFNEIFINLNFIKI